MRVFVYIAAFIPLLLLAEYRYPVGEKAVYTIQWGLIDCGTSTISCEEVEEDGVTLIRVRVRVKSNWLVSTVYPVDDTVDCFIDPETQLAVRLEKDTSEGDKSCKDILRLDRKINRAEWISQSDNITTNYPIAAGTCDAVSFIYAFRQHGFTEDEKRDYTIAVDAGMHGITIQAKGTANKKADHGEKVKCRKYLVTPKRDDLFIRKIPKAIWLTEDERKIMVRMDVAVPVGKARIVLDEYTPPAP